ncbi:MAG: hypothetical protein AAGA60_12245 [Cyanobacteria bacterium P01_E01_bin.42]
MAKIQISSSLVHWTTLGSLQLINAVIVIPLSFLLASQQGVKVLLGATLELSEDFSPESSAMATFMTLVIATIALIAGLISIFVSLALLREREWALLGTTIVQGCIIGTELSKFFLYVNPNFVALSGALTIVILCLLKLKKRADAHKEASVSNPASDPLPDPVTMNNEQ